MAINPIVDRPSRGGDRQRLRKLAQAALNADQTVDQVEGILGDVGPVLGSLGNTIDGLDSTIEKLNVTLDELNGTLAKVDDTVGRMSDVVMRLEKVVGRVEIIVSVAEQAFKPIGMLESAGHTIESVGRGIASRIGLS
ncbi:hypothetical protein [Gordonia neofelifaecis]|uniref:ATPase n=1 Tax=Gordonia neofelifaecis NRRL B-59395 TaxID=644548 RepID=F1YF36_9ACTN|nr:hypothetical protein [Gordonia neofelifaecis]EGD56376.1 hypothetical protein SCNU_02447 [Gordonia neofelifaecis NRRL B-59395]